MDFFYSCPRLEFFESQISLNCRPRNITESHVDVFTQQFQRTCTCVRLKTLQLEFLTDEARLSQYVDGCDLVCEDRLADAATGDGSMMDQFLSYLFY